MPATKRARKSATLTEKPHTFTVTGLARAWGLSQAQLSQWKMAGMPFGADGRIGLDEATRWIRQHERRERMRSDGSDAGKRRADAEAALMELKLARELGEVVLAAEVYEADEEEAARVRGIVQNLASMFAPMVATRLSCSMREASAVLRTIAEDLAAQIAADDDETEGV
jgi:hypothetical protein